MDIILIKIILGEIKMYFKKLIGKKCYLAPIDINDAEKYTEWLNDMEIIKNLQLYNAMISLESERAFLNNLSKEHNYSIIDLETNELIGNCGFIDIDFLNQTAEIGIFLGNKTKSHICLQQPARIFKKN